MLALCRVADRQRASLLCGVFALLFAGVVAAQAQAAQSPPDVSILVSGDGSVSVPPDYAEVRTGATTRAKTAKEAADANTRLMTAITAALSNAGIAQKDIRTSRFSVQPVYAAPLSGAEQKLTGFSASNQVTVTIRDLGKVGDILDRVVAAGATDIGDVQFLHADVSKALDQARDAAIADARRKAEIYAHAADIRLGGVAWIAEDGANVLPMPRMMRASGGMPPPPPISPGEDVMHVRVTVGFGIAH